MALFGRWADLDQFPDIGALRTHFAAPDESWTSFTNTVGDFENDIRILDWISGWHHSGHYARLNELQPCPSNSNWAGVLPGETGKCLYSRSGLTETEFQDIGPWAENSTVEPARQSTTSTGIKENILNMSALIDQADDSELVPPTATEVNTWLQNYHAVMQPCRRKLKS